MCRVGRRFCCTWFSASSKIRPPRFTGICLHRFVTIQFLIMPMWHQKPEWTWSFCKHYYYLHNAMTYIKPLQQWHNKQFNILIYDFLMLTYGISIFSPTIMILKQCNITVYCEHNICHNLKLRTMKVCT